MKKEITVKVNNKNRTVPEGTVLSAFVKADMPCGGHGNCGKCRVTARGALSPMSERERSYLTDDEIARGVRLACYTKALGECEIFTGAGGGDVIATDSANVTAKAPMFKNYGVAIDIGTTTLAASLYDKGGNVLALAGMLNPQSVYGADVISRIEAAVNKKSDELADTVRRALTSLLDELAQKGGIDTTDIDGAVITGNTVMLHLLTKTDTEPLSRAPFKASRLFGEYFTAQKLGIRGLLPDTVCYLPPCISAFLGADAVCTLLTVRNSDSFLLADIGTNGEIILNTKGTLSACSTAAGPAFEGAGIKMGMRAKEGAVDKVDIVNGRLFAHVIGDTKPVGICGSGLADAVSCLLKTEELDSSGYLEKDAVIAPPVKITPDDIRMVQLAKSAVRAAIETLVTKCGTSANSLDKIYIAGGFGSYLDIESIMTIGLLPRVAKSKVQFLGNAALSGAALLLLDRDLCNDCTRIASKTDTVELANDHVFTENYIKHMSF